MNFLDVEIKDKILLTIPEAMQYSNIGESKLRNIMNIPQCNFVLMNGKKKLIKREKFKIWLENQDFI